MSSPTLEQVMPRAAELVAVDGRQYPLEAARILARAGGGFASSTLAQTFANPFDEPLEVTYTLPLPADGAVLGYTITIGERVIRAEVQPREQAAAAYKQALYEGRTAGLLEQARPDTFEQKLGNVPPRTRVEVTIDVLHALAFVATDAGPQWEYRFPTVVGVRYLGAPGRVSDAEALSPDRGEAGTIPVTMGFSLVVSDENAGASLRCTSHGAIANGPGLEFERGEKLDRDVLARWNASASAIGVRVAEGAGLPGDEGRYTLVTIVPPTAPRATDHRDLTLLIDASGSMSGQPLGLAVRVAGELLRSLAEGDRFEVLAFANDVRSLTRGIHAFGAKSLAKALTELAKLEAGGATEMGKGIEEALTSLRDDAQRQVVLITDGQIGFEAEVVGRITDAGNVRLHAVGVGSAPNRSLTQQAAAAGRGIEVLASDERAADEAARRLVAGTAQPVLTRIEVAGSAITGDRPEHLRDVFAGQPLTFAVELSPSGGTLELTGRVAGEHTPWTHRVSIPAVGTTELLTASSLPVGALYGRERIAALELSLGSRHALRDAIDMRIEALGMRHRIASRRTSLVAIAEEPSVDPREPRRKQRLAVELPHGVSAEGVGLEGRRGVLVRSLGLHAVAAGEVAAGTMLDSLEVMSAPARAVRRLPGMALPRKPAPPAPAHAHWLSPSELALEITVPFEGFTLPTGTVRFAEPGDPNDFVELPVVAEASTPAGPHRTGAEVRLVIRIVNRLPWAVGSTLVMAIDQALVAFQIPQRPDA
jgi:Ca-activated chloride channel family protein